MQTITQTELSELITATKQEMERRGYAAATIQNYEKIWRILTKHAVKKTSPYTQLNFHMSF
jgi:hypothetical protein